MIRWILIVGMLGFLTGIQAEMDQSTLAGQNSTQAFWNVYTDALRGDKVAQFQVGVMFERGMSINKNEAEAAGWYEKSAKQGYVDAQYNLGIMYASGRGVQQNDSLAIMWLGLAAKQGDNEARKVLLALIDEKVPTVKADKVSAAGSVNTAGETQSIAPVTLVCKDRSIVCSRHGGEGECIPYKTKTVLTSTEKRGSYYKISGVVENRKWKGYAKEGWVEESSVELRR